MEVPDRSFRDEKRLPEGQTITAVPPNRVLAHVDLLPDSQKRQQEWIDAVIENGAEEAFDRHVAPCARRMTFMHAPSASGRRRCSDWQSSTEEGQVRWNGFAIASERRRCSDASTPRSTGVDSA